MHSLWVILSQSDSKLEPDILAISPNSKTRQSCTPLRRSPPGGGGVLPHIGYIGVCGPKGWGFTAVLVINRVSILADFGHFGHK